MSIPISYFRYDELYIDLEKKKIKVQVHLRTYDFSKSNITPSLIVALEMRVTPTDNLDGSNPKKESLKSSQFGNINNNDWYVFQG
jgi:hypothetical protein